MKLILTHEVTGLGEPGDVVEVKDGYGRNYLIPRGLATVWTKGAQKQIDSIRQARKAREIESLDEARSLRDKLQEAAIRVRVRSGAEGRLYGAVTTSEIAETLAENNVKVDKRKIEIDNPIKSLGDHTVKVRLHPEVQAVLKVNVAPEKKKK